MKEEQLDLTLHFSKYKKRMQKPSIKQINSNSSTVFKPSINHEELKKYAAERRGAHRQSSNSIRGSHKNYNTSAERKPISKKRSIKLLNYYERGSSQQRMQPRNSSYSKKSWVKS